jgi:hypothetical protein
MGLGSLKLAKVCSTSIGDVEFLVSMRDRSRRSSKQQFLLMREVAKMRGLIQAQR